MADFPTDLSNVQDNVTDVLAKHINNLEVKVGVNSSAVTTSLDYKVTNRVISPATNSADYLPQWDWVNSKTLKNGLAVPAGGLAWLTALWAKADIDSPNFTTDIYSPLVLAGATAASADWPTAKVIGSQADSGHSYTGNIGVVGESVASATDTWTGVGWVSVTNWANESRWVTWVGKVWATWDTAKANGVYGYVNWIHAWGDNIGVRGSAINGANNYAFYWENGKIYSSWDIEIWHLTDTTLHRDSAWVLSIEWVKIMTVGLADTVTGVKTLGTTWAIKLGSAVTDKCEIRLNDSALNDETWSGTVLECVAWATLAVGDVCYLKTADWQWYLNDGILDGTDTWFKLKLWICVLAANDNGATKMLLDGLIASAAFPAFTVGAPVYLDDTAWDLVVAQPSTTNFAIRVVGEAVSSTVLHFHPSNDYIVHI